MNAPDDGVLGRGLRRITAPNPGPMTGPGTNSYIVGTGPCVIVDPGTEDARHLDRLAASARGPIVGVLLTHAHADHSDGARELAGRLDVPIRASAATHRGLATDARAETTLSDGDELALGEITLRVLHTPGHTGDHLCFYLPESRLLLAGDTVMADVTVVILPPDGSMSAYLATIDRLSRLTLDAIAPGHGRLLGAPARVLAAIRAHRLAREDQVRGCLSDAPIGARDIAARLYPALDHRLMPMASAQVEAHLIRLQELGEAGADGTAWRRRP